jgi:hypothetical protein
MRFNTWGNDMGQLLFAKRAEAISPGSCGRVKVARYGDRDFDICQTL